MDRLQRIYQLHRLIVSRRQPVSHAALEEHLECSRATVNRIIEALRLHFNAPLKYDHERNGYFYDTKETGAFELPGVWFNATELYALLAVQQLLEQAQPGLLDAHLKPIKERLEKILASEYLGSGEVSGRVRILRMTGRSTSNEHFQSVAGALLQRKRLAICYHSRGNNQETQREISPQRLTHYRDNWYLDAWCHTRKALRSFAVERIRASRTLNQDARNVAEPDLDAHFAASYGIFAGKPKHTAVLHFTAECARWVAEEQWHPQQQGKFLEDGGYELRIPYADPRELVMDILKHGTEVKVIAPVSLRRVLREQLEAALMRYADK